MVHCANGNHKGLQQISGTGYRSGSGLKKSMENHVSWSETVRALRTCGTTGLSSWASPSLSSKQMVFSDVLHHRLSLPWRTDSAVFCFFVFCFVIRGNGPLCGFTLLRWGVFFVVFSFSSLSLPGLCCLDSVPHFPLVRNHDFPNLTNLVGLTLCEDALFECSPPLGNVQRQRWFIYTKEEMCLSFCRLNSVGKSLIFLPVAGCGYHTVKNLSWRITLQVRLLAKQRLCAKTEIVTYCVTVDTLRCLR